MNKTIFAMLVISAMSMSVLIGCKGKESEEPSPPPEETQPPEEAKLLKESQPPKQTEQATTGSKFEAKDYEIRIETRPWLIWFKPADPNQINTPRKLIEVFRVISPNDVQWSCSPTTQNGQLMGQVWIPDKAQRDKIIRIIDESDGFVVVKSCATYTIAFKATGGESVSSKTLLDMLHEHYPEGVNTRRYCSRKENGSLIGYISTDTESEKDKLVSKLYSNPDLELVEVIGPEHD